MSITVNVIRSIFDNICRRTMYIGVHTGTMYIRVHTGTPVNVMNFVS